MTALTLLSGPVDTFDAASDDGSVELQTQTSAEAVENLCRGVVDLAVTVGRQSITCPDDTDIVEMLIGYQAFGFYTQRNLTCLTGEQIIAILEGDLATWGELNADLPTEPIILLGPPAESWVYNALSDYTLPAQTDDMESLFARVGGDPNILGVGPVQASEYDVPVQTPNGECIPAEAEYVQHGQYGSIDNLPMSRQVVLYVHPRGIEQTASLLAFLFGAEDLPLAAERLGYISPPTGTYDENLGTIEFLLQE